MLWAMDRTHSFWWDNWHSLGPLYLRYGVSLGHSVGRALVAKVIFIIENGCWKWPGMRSFVTQDIIANTPTSFYPIQFVMIQSNGLLNPSGSFSTKSAWEAIGVKAPIVPWHKVIWCSHYGPKWAIIEWIAFLGRLPTKDRLHARGFVTDDGCGDCGLYGLKQETHAHPFFSCEYSADSGSGLWAHFLQANGISRAVLSLQDEVAWIGQHSRSSKFKHTVFKLSLAAVVHSLWREWNCRSSKGRVLVMKPLLSRSQRI